MRKITSTFVVSLVLLAISGFPATFAADLPAELQVGDQKLQLNGEGLRKKLFIKLYRAGLYLQQPTIDAAEVMSADKPMAINLEIISSMITKKKMVAAIEEGFAKNPANSAAAMQKKIKDFIGTFDSGVAEKDSFSFQYQPGQGLAVYKQGKQLQTIPGVEFKSALFGIWLSDSPVQKNLKQAMLGG